MKLKSTFCVLIALCLATSTPAQDWFFDGSTANPGDWNDPLNWDMDTVPVSVDPMDTTNVYIGHNGPLATATANISGSLTSPVIGDLRIGAGGTGGANGTVNHSAGVLTTDTEKWAFVGLDGPMGNPNTGTYNLSGTAEFNSTGELHLGIGGGAGAGNEGHVTLADSATMNLDGLTVGSNDGNLGTFTQSGGTVNVVTAYVGDGNFGTGGIGVYNQTAGDVTVDSWLSIGRDNGGDGTYNMSGGSLFVGTDFLTVGENNGANGQMNVSGDASIDVANLAVGRFGGGATGKFTVNGDQASIVAANLLVGRNDQNNFDPEDASGTLRFESTASGVSAIEVLLDAYLNDGSVIGSSNLEVNLSASPATGDILLVSVGGLVDGTFAGLPEGALVPGSGGRTITYMGGDGNDIVLLEGTGIDGDFNDDGLYNCTDVDDLVGEIAAGTNAASFDLNSDGVVNTADLDDWRSEAGAVNLGAGKVYLEGDATLDGTVDGLDFIEWNGSKFTSTAEWCSGDFNADGTVDGLDFIIWNEHKFTSSDAVAVPEPAAMGLVLMTLAGAVAGRRRGQP